MGVCFYDNDMPGWKAQSVKNILGLEGVGGASISPSLWVDVETLWNFDSS